LTGAIGGSCISYIGPGLVYLGCNGESFLDKVGGWVDAWRRSKGYTTNSGGTDRVSEDDLPMEGDATLELARAAFTYASIRDGSKPLWYYLFLFPWWCSIANYGAERMDKKVAATTALSNSSPMPEDDGSKETLPPPTNWDFTVMVFFILFGLVSAIAGVVSNVSVQLGAT